MKALKILFSIIILVCVILYLYIFRQQAIAVNYIPNEFEHCGNKIGGQNKEYLEIVKWLENNKEGWVASFVTYAPNNLYTHPAFSVNVLKGSVIVSYKTEYGYPQLVKTIKHNINSECAKDS
jgi:hypothetical protein